MELFPVIVAVVATTGAIALVVKGWDVRVVLLAAALLIAAAAEVAAQSAVGMPAAAVARVVRQFLATFSNERFVVPICTAMGFAYVLKHTGCDQHLVWLLINPLRRVRGLLIPGVVVVGFCVNIPLISQTSTAVSLGAVVVPLLRAAGYSMPTIGACLLLGASVGGELLNPGAPELLTVFNKTNVPTTVQATQYLPGLVFTQLATATLILWLMSRWWERTAAAPEALPQADAPAATSATVDHPRVNLWKAIVPLVPITLLFATALPAPYQLWDVPDEWVIPRLANGERDPAYNSRLIGLAMLLGVVVAAAVSLDKARDCVKEFFAGAGYGFANVVSLIVVANCFGEAIRIAGLAELLGTWIEQTPPLMQPLAAFIPLSFAAVSGSGMASTQSLYGFFYAPAVALGLDPVAVGAMVSLGSAAGRTMSPVAAVTLMCATLTGTNPFTLAQRVAIPLLGGITLVVLLRVMGWL
ncbi:MAG: C4-dicarboxylate transporter DcuC [Gemmataceae bacterium]|nr:C4-dicarboxylate transporter DcuC [Gemmata sp.]MDW8196822.1 C4-dicarboxylate transporter DcuC [Gemmataceae bacterium]